MIAGSISIELMANVARLQRDMDAARQSVGSATAQIERAANAAKTALGGIAAGLGLRELARMSDEYTKFTAQLKLATQSQREYAAAYSDVKRIATSAQQDLGATGMLYARIANGTKELGVSQRRVADITETVNMALKVSGATAQESASAQLQLSQAFASGTLRGEEFNAVNEAAPRLMQALADGMGVARGELKKMAEDGKITSQIMADVLPKSLESLRQEAAQMQTISGALTVLKSNFMEFIGTQAQASGAVSAVTGAIGFLARNIDVLATAGVSFIAVKIGRALDDVGASVGKTYLKTVDYLQAQAAQRASAIAAAESELTTAKATSVRLAATEAAIIQSRAEVVAKLASTDATIAATQAQIAASRAAGAQSFALASLAQAERELTAATARRSALTSELALLGQQQTKNSALSTVAAGAQTLAQNNLAKATSGAGAAAGLFSRALGLLGGPIGAITTVLGLGATAWALWGNSATEQEKKVEETLSQKTEAIVADLERQIEKLKERNKLAASGAIGATEPTDSKEKQREALIAEITRIGARTDINDVARMEMMRAYGAQLNELTLDMAAQADEQKSLFDKTRDTRLAEWFGKNGTAAQRMAAELADLRKQFGTLPPEMEKLVRAKYASKADAKAESDALNELAQSYESLYSAGQSRLTDANQALAAQREENAAIGLTRQQVTELAAKKIELEAASDREHAASMRNAAPYAGEFKEAYLQYAGAIERAAAAKDALAAEKRTGAAKQAAIDVDLTAAREYLDIMSQVDEVTRNAAQGMADAFGRVGTAIGGLTTAISGYGRAQAAIAAQHQAALAKAGNDPAKIAAANVEAAKLSTQAQARSYGDMASAAKGFFKEHTAGYKVMEGVEKAYRAQEMVLAIENMLAKSGLLTSFTGLFVASKATEEAVDTAATGKSVIRSGIRATADGVAAFAKTLASVPFPYNIAAGASVVALLAAAGVAVRGGGSAPASSADRQRDAGTGSVFGDASAKSDSIAKSLGIIEKNSQLGLTYSGGMLQSLRNIEASMAGFTNLVVRGIDTSGAFSQGGPSFSRRFLAPNEAGFLSLNDNGLAKLLQTGDSFSTRATAKLLGSIFGGKQSLLDTGLTANAVRFGNLGALNAMSYQDIKKEGGIFRSDKYRTETGSLGAEANAQIAQIIRDMGGAITAAAGMLGMGGAAFTARLNQFVVDIGKISLKDLSGEEIQKQFAAIFSKLGDDMARWGVAGLADFQKVGEGYFETLSRIASDYAAVDGILRSIGTTFGATGIASVKARERLIELTGGIDKLAEQTNSFAQNYLTEAERLAPVQQYVTEQMTAMGYASVKTKDQFKALVLGMVQSGALATKEGAENYAKLMQIEDLFAKAYDGAQELLSKQRDAVTAAYEREADAMRQAIDRHTAFADSMRSLIDSTKLGSMSPLTPEQKYAEAKAQYNAIAAAALTGDAAAQARYREAHDAFLSISQTLNASDGRYIADYMTAQANNQQLLAYSQMQISVEQAALDAARAQVSGILAVEQAVKSLPEAIAQYFAAGGTQPGAQLPPVAAPVPTSSQQTQTDPALLAELQALRKEVAALRADQQQQTGATVQATLTAAQINANMITGAERDRLRSTPQQEALA